MPTLETIIPKVSRSAVQDRRGFCRRLPIAGMTKPPFEQWRAVRVERVFEPVLQGDFPAARAAVAQAQIGQHIMHDAAEPSHQLGVTVVTPSSVFHVLAASAPVLRM